MTRVDERRALERLRRIGVDGAQRALEDAERARAGALEAHEQARHVAQRERARRDEALADASASSRPVRAAELSGLAAFREARDAGLAELDGAAVARGELAAAADRAAAAARAELAARQAEHAALVRRLEALEADARRLRERVTDDEASELHAARRA